LICGVKDKKEFEKCKKICWQIFLSLMYSPPNPLSTSGGTGSQLCLSHVLTPFLHFVQAFPLSPPGGKRGKGYNNNLLYFVYLFCGKNNMSKSKKFDFGEIKKHARELRKNMTESERLLWRELKGRG